MDFVLPEGKYLVAVSGGVDSVVLLDLLYSFHNTELNEFVVAHFDHGIRPDSAKDANFVKELSESYGFEFVTEKSNLGINSSEEKARIARYEFLRITSKKLNLDAVLTAHHQDDLIETIFLHTIRGTGRYGLDPMSRTKDIIRPLLKTKKQDLISYAQKNKLDWQEDSTNKDEKYLRNALRKTLSKNLNQDSRDKILLLNESVSIINLELDELLNGLGSFILDKKGLITRSRFVILPFDVECEYIKKRLSFYGVKDISKQLVSRVVIASKTLEPGKKIDCGSNHWLKSNKLTLEILRK